jgi:hypothetical protein
MPCDTAFPQPEPNGSPKFLTLLSTHPTLFVDPGRPSVRSPKRVLCVGFWGVNTIAICITRLYEAVSRFGECGLPCGLRGSLCTLQLFRSAFHRASSTVATLGMSGWLDLPQPGLPPGKKRQASLGAPTTCGSAATLLSGRRQPYGYTIWACFAMPTRACEFRNQVNIKPLHTNNVNWRAITIKTKAGPVRRE